MIDLEKLDDDAKREILASVGAAHFADFLQLAVVKRNENGSVTFSFVADDEQKQQGQLLWQ